MTIRIASILCALVLALPACGGEAKTTETKTTKTVAVEPPAVNPEVKPEQPAPDKIEEPTAPDPNAEKVKTAAAIAREIAADPEHADEILRRHELDRDKLDAMMFEIAADPTLTEAYMAARRTT